MIAMLTDKEKWSIENVMLTDNKGVSSCQKGASGRRRRLDAPLQTTILVDRKVFGYVCVCALVYAKQVPCEQNTEPCKCNHPKMHIRALVGHLISNYSEQNWDTVGSVESCTGTSVYTWQLLKS